MPPKKNNYTDKEYDDAVNEVIDFFHAWSKKHLKKDRRYPIFVYSIAILNEKFEEMGGYCGSAGNTDEMIEIHCENIMKLRDIERMEEAEKDIEKMVNEIKKNKELN
jgi:hypothetical protein